MNTLKEISQRLTLVLVSVLIAYLGFTWILNSGIPFSARVGFDFTQHSAHMSQPQQKRLKSYFV
jgi:hypothetical protein